jgi:oxygen-independent coproporphyrinogen-3 oxidase
MSPRKPSSPSSRSPSERTAFLGGKALPFSLYLHLPFCLSKCPYCDFASLPLEAAGGLPAARRYLDALAVELDLRAASSEFFGAPVVTIYFGGGTPSLLPAQWIADLLQRVGARFDVAADAEITVEANPGTVQPDEAAALLEAGLTRFSLGVQSFSDRVLNTLGRAHTAADADAAMQTLRRAGVENLSLDLIYGVPNQSLEEWQDTLNRALSAAPEHISTYGLSVEPETPLGADIAAGRLPPPQDDVYAAMYNLADELLSAAGYEHYEISNFALAGCECRHNRRYWANAEYLGVGVSAHCHRGGLRWNNFGDFGVYTAWLERGILPVERAEALSAPRQVGEMLMLGLRTADGVVEDEVAARCHLGPREVFGEEIAELCQQGLLAAAGGRLSIPRDRWLISSEILARLIGS